MERINRKKKGSDRTDFLRVSDPYVSVDWTSFLFRLSEQV